LSKNSKRLMNKKAISPLIATVLLIAFSIALGAIIMNWGKTYVESEIESSREEYYAIRECDTDISIKIKEIESRPKLCYTYDGDTNLTIEFMIENTGPKTVEGIRVRAIGVNGHVNYTGPNFLIENTSISPGGILYNITTFNVPSSFEDLAQVEFIPFLTPTGATEKTLCSKSTLEKSDIGTC